MANSVDLYHTTLQNQSEQVLQCLLRLTCSNITNFMVICVYETFDPCLTPLQSKGPKLTEVLALLIAIGFTMKGLACTCISCDYF